MGRRPRRAGTRAGIGPRDAHRRRPRPGAREKRTRDAARDSAWVSEACQASRVVSILRCASSRSRRGPGTATSSARAQVCSGRPHRAPPGRPRPARRRSDRSPVRRHRRRPGPVATTTVRIRVASSRPLVSAGPQTRALRCPKPIGQRRRAASDDAALHPRRVADVILGVAPGADADVPRLEALVGRMHDPGFGMRPHAADAPCAVSLSWSARLPCRGDGTPI